MIKQLVSSTAFAFAAAAALAAPISFDFKDPKGVNNVAFHLDAPLESISGTASGITGNVMFDPANPAALNGKIVIASNSLKVPNSTMQDHLHSPNWIDVAKHPEITFEVTKVANAKTAGTDTTADVTGNLTIKGVTKPVTIDFEYSGTAVDPYGNTRIGLDGKTTVNRKDWGVNWNAALETGGVLVSEKVTLEFEVSAVRTAA